MKSDESLGGLWPLVLILLVIGFFLGFVAVLCMCGFDCFVLCSWEQVYYLTGSIAIIIGGVWALFTWNHNEKIRRFREMPGIEMDISFREQRLPNEVVLLEINTTAKNTSVIPIPVNIEGLTLTIERRRFPSDESILPRQSPDTLLFKCVIERGQTKELTLEPMTATVFTEYFAALPETLYAVKFSIPYKDTKWVWEKTRLHFVERRS
jgi:hypothetical protein